MILICPSCQTRYVLDDASVSGRGRNVRCRACGHTWFAKSAETLSSEAEYKDDSGLTREQVERLRHKAVANAQGKSGPHAEIRERERRRRQRNRMIAASTAWTTGAAIFCGAAVGAVAYRDKVVDAWPKTASIYKMAGMPVNRFGLDFEDLEAQRSFDGTTPILTISGRVVNVSEQAQKAPMVRIGLLDEAGEVVHEEHVNLYDNLVPAGGTSSFMARVVSPPMDSFRLTAAFEAQHKKAHGGYGDHTGQYSYGHHDDAHVSVDLKPLTHDDHSSDSDHEDSSHNDKIHGDNHGAADAHDDHH